MVVMCMRLQVTFPSKLLTEHPGSLTILEAFALGKHPSLSPLLSNIISDVDTECITFV